MSALLVFFGGGWSQNNREKRLSALSRPSARVERLGIHRKNLPDILHWLSYKHSSTPYSFGSNRAKQNASVLEHLHTLITLTAVYGEDAGDMLIIYE